MPADFSKHTVVLPLNDPERLRAYFAEHGAKTAALIVEPVPANSGLLIQTQEFLQLCRDLTAEHGAMLIFGMRGSIYRSADAGATWQKVEIDTTASFNGGRVLSG